jgi:hypothetical protein
MPPYVWLVIFHPILITLLTILVLVPLLRWTGLWARYKYRILLALLAAYAVDAAFALPRILFAYGLSKGPAIAQQIPMPRRLVLVNVPCGAKCHDLLISGAVEEIISVTPRRPRYASPTTAVRYQAGWTLPTDCPHEREKENRDPSFAQRQSGYCPLVEPVEIPQQGVFLIHEAVQVLANESARAYTPTFLVKAPPNPVIHYSGIEVQDRASAGTTVLASAYRYEAPGLLGLPPLIGCWNRPDNVIWVMPPGDTGCGFWRWFTWGGDDRASYDPQWLFEQAFGPPDHQFVPPQRAELPPATPAQALEILNKVWNSDFEFHLPRLRDALTDPSNADQALADLIVSRARRGNLEGSLIALLAAKRPTALVGLSMRLDPMPRTFGKSGAVLDEMEKNPDFRDDFAETVFLALATRWEARDNIPRFLNLMENSHPGWLCERLPRFTGADGIRRTRENGGMMNGSLVVPPFMGLVVERAAPRCPDATIDLLRALPREPDLVLRFCQLQRTDGTIERTDGAQRASSAKTKEFCGI